MADSVISEAFIYIHPDVNPATAEGIISFMSERLAQAGYVDGSFCEAVLEREKKYPTGLKTKTHAVAIPHADPEKPQGLGQCAGERSEPAG